MKRDKEKEREIIRRMVADLDAAGAVRSTRRYRLAVSAEAWSAYCWWELGPDAEAWPVRGVPPWMAGRDGKALATRRNAEEFAQRVSSGAAVVTGIAHVVTVYRAAEQTS